MRIILLTVLLSCFVADACFAQDKTQSSGDTAAVKTTAPAKAVVPGKKTGGKPAAKTVTKTAKGGAITGAQAVELVKSLPEVKAYLARLRKSKRTDGGEVELDRTENGVHIVHVYESVMDSPDSGHTATFNWYNVNAKTRKITKEF